MGLQGGFKMKKLYFIPLSIFIAFAYACNNPGIERSAAGGRKEIAIGASALDFTLRDLQEKNASLSEYRGKVVLLTFWKVKCKDCTKTLPSVESLEKKLNSQDFAVLTVNVDNLEYVKPEKIHAYLKENNYTFRVLVDETFSTSEAYKLLAVPMTYLIDKKGTVADIRFGEQDWTSQENIDRVQNLLNK